MATLHHVFRRLDVDAFESVLGRWAQDCLGEGEATIAIDEINWTGVPGATHYRIHRNGTFLTQVQAPQTHHAYADLGRSFSTTSGTTYRVRACDDTGCSALTDPVSPSRMSTTGDDLPNFIVGICEPGLIMSPQEGCVTEDRETIVYSASRDGTEISYVCFMTKTVSGNSTKIRSSCDYVVEITDDLIAAISESKDSWGVAYHPLSTNRPTSNRPTSTPEPETPDEYLKFTSIDASSTHVCGLLEDRTIHCWGSDVHGQSNPPEGTFTSVSAGRNYSCGVKDDGTINCWGDEFFGNLTTCSANMTNCRRASWNGERIPRGQFTSVSVGYSHICAIKTNESASCWRGNAHGQAEPPRRETFAQADAGDRLTCGLGPDGSITCWGDDDDGQSTPPTGTGTFTSVSVGFKHSCAVESNGSMTCWGSYKDRGGPQPAGTFTSVSVGTYHACAVNTGGQALCWGNNDYGQATPPNGEFTSVTTGNKFTCGITNDDSVKCWGTVPMQD